MQAHARFRWFANLRQAMTLPLFHDTLLFFKAVVSLFYAGKKACESAHAPLFVGGFCGNKAEVLLFYAGLQTSESARAPSCVAVNLLCDVRFHTLFVHRKQSIGRQLKQRIGQFGSQL